MKKAEKEKEKIEKETDLYIENFVKAAELHIDEVADALLKIVTDVSIVRRDGTSDRDQ